MIIISGNDFHKGIFENVLLIENKLILNINELVGSYNSDVIEIDQFEQIIASWNGNTNDKSSVELEVQICCKDRWSSWFTYGKWSDKGFNEGSVANQKDDIAKMEIDVIKIISGNECNKFR